MEKREYYFTQDVEWIENRSDWANLNAIGMVRSTRIVEGEKRTELRYFIASLTDVIDFARQSESTGALKTRCIGVWMWILTKIAAGCGWTTVAKTSQ